MLFSVVFYTVSLLIIGFTRPVTAQPVDNNTTAIALPLNNITIDGLLDDWPVDMPHYEIRRNTDPYGPIDLRSTSIDTSSDFSPQFRVGYNDEQKKIYIALMVRDDHFSDVDGCALYIGLTENKKKSYRFVFLQNQELYSYESGSDGKYLKTNAEELGARVLSQTVGDTIVYEWELSVLDSVDNKPIALRSNTKLYFDIVVADKDDDNFTLDNLQSFAWNADSHQALGTLGVLLLDSGQRRLSSIVGSVYNTAGGPAARHAVTLSDPHGNWRDQVVTSSVGRFRFWAIPGIYLIAAGKDKKEVEILAGQSVSIQLSVDSSIAPLPEAESIRFNTPIKSFARLQVGEREYASKYRYYKYRSGPDWSPDGKWIAYSHGEGDNFDIWIKSVDGGEPIRVTQHPAPDRIPRWSPNGKEILFASERSGAWCLWTIDPFDETKEIRQISADTDSLSREGRPAAWSPDGREIVFASERGENSDLYIVSSDGGTARPFLTRPDSYDWDPDWSPDGEWIAFNSASDGPSGFASLWKVARVDTTLVPLNPMKKIASYSLYSPAWSPDGEKIAFVSHTGVGGMGVFVSSSREPGFPRSIADKRVARYAPYHTGPRWSPDGSKLLFEVQYVRDSAGSDSFFDGTPIDYGQDSTALEILIANLSEVLPEQISYTPTYPIVENTEQPDVYSTIPISNIAVDGDLSDWPEDRLKFPIFEGIDRWGNFNVGYDREKSKAFVGIRLRDSDLVHGEIKDIYKHHLLDALRFGLWGEVGGIQIGCAGVNCVYRSNDEVGKSAIASKIDTIDDHITYETEIDLPEYMKDHVKFHFSLEVQNYTFPFFVSSRNVHDHIVLAEDRQIDKSAPIEIELKYASTKNPCIHCPVFIKQNNSNKIFQRAASDANGNLSMHIPLGGYSIFSFNESFAVPLTIGNQPSYQLELFTHPAQPETLETKLRKTIMGDGRRNGQWTNYGLEDHLEPQTIGAMFEDLKGRLWMGAGGFESYNFLSMYDGFEICTWTNFKGGEDFEQLTIQKFYEHNDGVIWMSTNVGLIAFDGDQFLHYKHLPFNNILHFYQKKTESVYLFTDNGIYKYSNGEFIYVDNLPSWSQYIEDPQGGIWISGEEGIERVDIFDDSLSKLQAINIPEEVDGYDILLADTKDRIWIADSSSLLYVYEDTEWKAVTDTSFTLMRRITCSIEDHKGRIWFGTWGNGLLRYEDGNWHTLLPADGLPNTQIFSSLVDRHGSLWLGSMGGSLSRNSPSIMRSYGVEHGLPHDLVFDILENVDGSIWFATYGGVAEFDRGVFSSIEIHPDTTQASTTAMFIDSQNMIWVGFDDGAVSRYSEGKWVHWDPDEIVVGGIGFGRAWEFAEDENGHIWMSRHWGVARFDGQDWRTYDSDRLRSIAKDADGRLWATSADWGIRRLEDGEWKEFEKLKKKWSWWTILNSSSGNTWLGGWSGPKGLATVRFSNEDQTLSYSSPEDLNFPTLLDNDVITLAEDEDQRLWVGTWGGGIKIWDGTVDQNLLQENGLPNLLVQKIVKMSNGDMWVAHEAGATRFRPSKVRPLIRLRGARSSQQQFGRVDTVELKASPLSPANVSIEFQGRSENSLSKHMKYVYRLKTDQNDHWVQTESNMVWFNNLEPGTHTFEVKAVDSFLNYSNAEQIVIEVQRDYLFLSAGSGGVLLVLAFIHVSIKSHKRRKALRAAEEALVKELEDELQVAHDLQLKLMPESDPVWQGFIITGRCKPATHVGGDIYQYFGDGKAEAIALADVTGHGMEAAVPVMVFSGILQTEMRYEATGEQLFSRLNIQLRQLLEKRTFICCAMAFLDVNQRRATIINAGLPYPLVYRNSNQTVEEVAIDAFPLGVREQAEYARHEIDLEPGDRLVLYSDGLIEVENTNGELLGFDGLKQLLARAARRDMDPKAMLNFVFAEVAAFDAAPMQDDDQTMVVIQVE